ncbi:MAG TPA: LppX_LprAFG lipoprotein [Nitrolancea sp.]|nr:LppX_LprAFG lipoprotein [Nitrolancea sp.]
MKLHSYRLASLALVLFLSLGLAAACRGKSKPSGTEAAATPTASPTPSPTPTPTPTAQGILQQASDRWNHLDSLHFNLQIEGVVALDSTGLVQLHSADGDLKRPGLAQATAKVSVAGSNLNMKMISLGTDQYITNFITGRWEKAPADLGYNPAVLFDKDHGVGAVLTSIQNPAIAGSESIDGQEAWHITGTVTKAAASAIVGGALHGDTATVDVWVSKSTHDLLKLVVHDPGAATPSAAQGAATWTLTTSKQNQPVTIERPNV